MKLHQKYRQDVFDKFRYINEHIEVRSRVLSENSDLTYHELRAFVTLLMKTIKDKNTKSVLSDILMALGKLEVLNRPAPTVRKMKGVSPKIFQ